jgi:hypothetical protein
MRNCIRTENQLPLFEVDQRALRADLRGKCGMVNRGRDDAGGNRQASRFQFETGGLRLGGTLLGRAP